MEIASNESLNAVNTALDYAIMQHNKNVRISVIQADLTIDFELAGFPFDGALTVATLICEGLKASKGKITRENLYKAINV